MSHVLDRPVWHALNTRHAALSEGNSLAKRYSPSVHPFASSRDESAESLAGLADIAIPGENQEGGTVVIPGHGRLGDETDVANYRDMVTIVRDRVQALIGEGKTLQQVQAARPTRDYDGIYSQDSSGWTGQEFVEAVYVDLKADTP